MSVQFEFDRRRVTLAGIAAGLTAAGHRIVRGETFGHEVLGSNLAFSIGAEHQSNGQIQGFPAFDRFRGVVSCFNGHGGSPIDHDHFQRRLGGAYGVEHVARPNGPKPIPLPTIVQPRGTRRLKSRSRKQIHSRSSEMRSRATLSSCCSATHAGSS